jgi:hypothetical protein
MLKSGNVGQRTATLDLLHFLATTVTNCPWILVDYEMAVVV